LKRGAKNTLEPVVRDQRADPDGQGDQVDHAGAVRDHQREDAAPAFGGGHCQACCLVRVIVIGSSGMSPFGSIVEWSAGNSRSGTDGPVMPTGRCVIAFWHRDRSCDGTP
jgi:hypothetical protein